ncbi:MAG TPA: SAM-dependent methyltransferase [Anaerolineaceae bacterium]|nr:SAM-dependent methyltransferase [Anaerolineaceae bacterium]
MSDFSGEGKVLFERVERALQARMPSLDSEHQSALRLFNGFYEGFADVLIDLYGSTLVIFNYHEKPVVLRPLLIELQKWLIRQFPWITAVVHKTRSIRNMFSRLGVIRYGDEDALTTRIVEHGVQYAVNLRLNQDASFYLDTRNLRRWLKDHMAGKSVLNTFAYTGSLGAAALAGGARRVVQTDQNPRFLEVARATYAMNGWAVNEDDFLIGDFFKVVDGLRRHKQLFDCVILDPPFFSSGTGGAEIFLNEKTLPLINKVRPLVAHEGVLIVVNNALFMSGMGLIRIFDEISQSGYIWLEEIIPVPPDVTGFPETRLTPPPVDPAPFNHPTKIAVLRVTRKDRAPAS